MLAGALAGCSAGVTADDRELVAQMGMGCEQARSFAFLGRATPASLGLDWFGGGPEANRVALIAVTADAVDMNMGMPGAAVAPERMVCIQFGDGSGAAGPVPVGWEPPAAVPGPVSGQGGGPPVALVGLVGAAVVIGTVSFFAFRGERS